MLYQVLSPFVGTIEGDSFKEAIKNFVKINYNVAINSMILQDQMNHYEARLRYFKENQKDKVGITVYPYNSLLNPTQIINSTPVINTSSNTSTIKIDPIVGAPGMISASAKGAVIPLATPYIPTVIKY
jgi:hypothetical protein